MSNTNDNTISNLNLNDTFYDWFRTTNSIIDLVNPLNVYDVYAGDGLSEVRSGIPGTIELNVLTDETKAITLADNGAEGYKVSLDLTDVTANNSVQNTDQFVYQRSGNIYKVTASNILPPTISSNHTFTGTVTVEDLVINSCSLTLNCDSTDRDNCGIVVESSADGSTNNVSFIYDTQTNSWLSSENLGIKKGKSFVSDSNNSIAYFPFTTSFTQGVVHLSLEKPLSSSITEKLIFIGEFNQRNKLTISNYSNTNKIDDLLILESGEGTNAVTTLTAPGAIVITDILNSSPFSATPVATSVPITDSDGFLTSFTNRVKLTISGGVSVGKVVRMSGSNAVLATPDTSIDSRVIGIVESLNGSTATVITSGPFSNITGLTGLTAGSVYYLDYSGGISLNPPPSTNNDVTKPIFVATSSTSGIIFPDLSSSATTSVSGINDAFTAVQISGQGGSGLFTASGTTTLTVEAGTGISVNKSSNKLVISATTGLPDTDPYAVYVNQDGTNGTESVVINSHSLLGRSTTGSVESITITPGSLIGRIEDGSNDNNPVGSLTQEQALNILGFSDNQYYKAVKIYNYAGTLIDTVSVDSNETLKFKAGANVTLTRSGTDTVVISSTGDTNNGGNGTESSPLNVTIVPLTGSNQTFQNVTQLSLLETTTIKLQGFSAENTDTHEMLYSIKATLNPNYLKLDDGVTTTPVIVHEPEDILQISGDKNITVSLSEKAGLNNFGLSLKNALQGITRITSTSTVGGVYSLRLDPYSSASTVKITSKNTTGGNLGVLQIKNVNYNSAVSKELNNDTYQENVGGSCIELYADNGDADPGYPVYYPIRTRILHADRIKCALLDVDDIALKLQLQTSNIKSYDEYSAPTDPQYGKITIQPAYSSLGIELKLDSGGNNVSYVYMPRTTNSAISGGRSQTKTVIMSERLQFAPESTLADNRTNMGTNITASFGYESGGGRSLYINSYDNATSQLIFKNTAANATTKIGFDGSGGYVGYNSGSGTDKILNLKTNATLLGVDSFSVGSTSGTGYKFTTNTTFTDTTTDGGKILYISSVSGGVATISQSYFVKQYSSGQDISSDPLYTLYYAT